MDDLPLSGSHYRSTLVYWKAVGSPQSPYRRPALPDTHNQAPSMRPLIFSFTATDSPGQDNRTAGHPCGLTASILSVQILPDLRVVIFVVSRLWKNSAMTRTWPWEKIKNPHRKSGDALFISPFRISRSDLQTDASILRAPLRFHSGLRLSQDSIRTF